MKQTHKIKDIRKTIRFTHSEFQPIEEDLIITGYSFTDYVKRAIINKPIRLPSNLNEKRQRAYKLNEISNEIGNIAIFAYRNENTNFMKAIISVEKKIDSLINDM